MNVEATVQDGRLDLRWADGHRSVFHGIWLRDNCPCAGCRHPATGQRIQETATLPDDVRLGRAGVGPEGVRVSWSDGHASVFGPGWLRAHCYCDADRAGAPPRARAWRAEGRPGLPAALHAEVVRDDAA